MAKAKKILINAIVLILCTCYLFPIYIVIVNSFKNRSELYENILALPEKLTFEYYAKALEKMSFLNALKNSLVVTLISIAIIVVLASMTAWMMVRVNNKISKLLFLVFEIGRASCRERG